MTEFYTNVIQWGNKILYRGYKDGRRVQERVDYEPTLYVNSKNKSKFKTLFDQYVEPINPGSIRDCKEFIETYKDVNGFDVYGMTQYNYQYIADRFPGQMVPDFDVLKISVIDIECASENGFPDPVKTDEEILLISIHEKNTNTNIVWGSRSYKKLDDDRFEYRIYKDEITMLRAFLDWWQANTPDILTGWNIVGFDIPYIINRISKIGESNLVNRLSPWGIVNSRTSKSSFGQETEKWDILGVAVLDYLELYKKYTYSAQESYALGYIAQQELGETKLEIEGSFKNAYTNHWDQFVRYNSKDTELVDRLDKKLDFIKVACTVAYLAKCNITDSFGPVKTWDIFIYNYLKAKNIVIPQPTRKVAGEFEGAWVKEPRPGMYGWTMSFDFAALYPSIIRQWNMSPETIMGVMPGVNVDRFLAGDIEKIDEDWTIAANGSMYKKDRLGIIPEVIKIVLDGRKIAKKEMLKLEQQYNDTKDESLVPVIAALNGRQMAFKILANSLYGAVANVGFRYYDLRIAEAITITGQASDRHIEITLNKYMNSTLKTDNVDYVIAGDTDSVYLNVDPLIRMAFNGKMDATVDNKVLFLDKVGKTKFQEQINLSIDTIFKIGNCYDRVMDMKREAIASKATWTAKKRYAMMVHNSEGVSYTPYKLKIMGMDLIKSSTPQSIRKQLKEALVVIFEKDQAALYDYVSDKKSKFMSMAPEEIAFPRSINDLEKYSDPVTVYKTATPIHVRASLMYNKLVKDNRDITPLKDGDKIKFIYLLTPNYTRENVIAFPSFGHLPKELKLHDLIDYETQWEKVFIAPLKGICDAIGWQPEKRASLDDFFS